MPRRPEAVAFYAGETLARQISLPRRLLRTFLSLRKYHDFIDLAKYTFHALSRTLSRRIRAIHHQFPYWESRVDDAACLIRGGSLLEALDKESLKVGNVVQDRLVAGTHPFSARRDPEGAHFT